MLKTQLSTLLVLCSLLFSTGSYASHISLLPTIAIPGHDEWEFALSIDLGPKSEHTLTESGVQISESPITGTLNIFFNSVYSGTPASLEVDFSSTSLALNPLILILDNNPTSTNQLSLHINNYGNSYCDSFPTSEVCLNFNPSNSSLGTPQGDFIFDTIESGLDIELDLGPLTFHNIGGGNTQVSINSSALQNDSDQISLFASSTGDVYSETFVFDSNPVPVPASAWLLLSGGVALFGFNRRKSS